MDQHDRALVSAPVARQPQLDLIGGFEGMDLGSNALGLQGPLLARRRVRLERRTTREDPAIVLEQRSGEEMAETPEGVELLGGRLRVLHAHRRELLQEVARIDGEDALAGKFALLVRSLEQRDVQRAGILPDLGRVGVLDRLESVEEPLATILRAQL